MNNDLQDYLPTLEDFLPMPDNMTDPERSDFDIWNLVGLDPVLGRLRQILIDWNDWAREDDECDILLELRKYVALYERRTYDRFTAKYPRPSEEIECWGSEPVVTGIGA